ncbi:hypothetical protein EHI8A_099820 [Entamoeba histolytica HM-1:IMSS-B]|uniref:Structure-specific endonuclease subunit SLX4 n=6 Tax=Entamoeba histolytica TaxID=5759 RepID=C4LZN9_ENTH1|nr:hypothetical protein EHI_038550 [Entamoeba histolytica HM-1:IMSS]EMD48954.1 Hypothetical protein EHI5A_038510 [Entamoeba histolytica KU27]EMH72092.1 hypothetical protein EHI8A_099820 [Entamoeba histolytica HM-1:IMSS-B]EMS16277.1 hypothetical protein KM1_050180 [Entamoeba histolytica HM-3:IMSS]ENY61436.1 hypothetical protein EHI7A_092440 [Entamoeba histolytica HM-1:IMSS-A]GAT94342.1 hypothetical protein CL6EHI_038550 [Entamoeba histolytica]|eukprot:XP_656853.1 hypothetical protein EHI_038550 [Entamoeba histolytica HM-1:IMSS]
MNERKTQAIEEIEIIDDNEIEIHDDMSDQEWISAVLNHPVFCHSKTPEVVCVGSIDPERRKLEGIKLFGDTEIPETSKKEEIVLGENSTCLLVDIPLTSNIRKGKTFYGVDEMKQVTGIQDDEQEAIQSLDKKENVNIDGQKNVIITEEKSTYVEEEEIPFSQRTTICDDGIKIYYNKNNKQFEEVHDFIEIEACSQRYCREELSIIEKENTQGLASQTFDNKSSFLLHPIFNHPKNDFLSQDVYINKFDEDEEQQPVISQRIINHLEKKDVQPECIITLENVNKSSESDFLKRKVEILEWFDKELASLINEKERRLRQLEIESFLSPIPSQPISKTSSFNVNEQKNKTKNEVTHITQLNTPIKGVNESPINNDYEKQKEETKPKKKHGKKWKRFKEEREITEWFKNQPIYEDILMYNAIDIDDCIYLFKTAGYLVTKKFLKEYFEKNGVNYYDAARENANKRGAGNF